MSRRPTPGPRRRPRPSAPEPRPDPVVLTGAILCVVRAHFGHAPDGTEEMGEAISALADALGAQLGAFMADHDSPRELRDTCAQIAVRLQERARIAASIIRISRGAVNGGHE